MRVLCVLISLFLSNVALDNDHVTAGAHWLEIFWKSYGCWKIVNLWGRKFWNWFWSRSWKRWHLVLFIFWFFEVFILLKHLLIDVHKCLLTKGKFLLMKKLKTSDFCLMSSCWCEAFDMITWGYIGHITYLLYQLVCMMVWGLHITFWPVHFSPPSAWLMSYYESWQCVVWQSQSNCLCCDFLWFICFKLKGYWILLGLTFTMCNP